MINVLMDPFQVPSPSFAEEIYTWIVEDSILALVEVR
jgi:hypothetical protein